MPPHARRSILCRWDRLRDPPEIAGNLTPGSDPGAVCVARAADFTVVFAGRLDGRADLLGHSTAPPADDSDAGLVLAVLRERGLAGLDRLLGDWACVVAEAAPRRLHAARSFPGAVLLHCAVAPGAIWVGTRIDSLLDHAGLERRLDERRAVHALVPELEWSDDRLTCFRGIERIRPGFRRWWSPSAEGEVRMAVPEASARPDGDGCDAVRSVLAAALDDRMRATSRVGIFLSGGIDSQVLYGGLVERSRKRGQEPPATYSAVSVRSARCPEYRRIRPAIDVLSGRHVVLDATESRLFDAHRRAFIEQVDDPFVVPLVGFRTILADRAARDGIDTVVTGLDGDLVFGEPFHALGRLVSALGPMVAAHRAFRYAASLRWERTHLIWDGILRQLLPGRVRSIGRGRRERKRTAKARPIGYLRPEVAREHEVQDQLRYQAVAPARGPDGAWYSSAERLAVTLSAPTIGTAVDRYARMASCLGVVCTHPFLDRRVLEVAMSLDLAQRIADGRSKGILYESARPWVPPAARTGLRTTNPDHWSAIADQLAATILEILAEDPGPAGELIDLDRARRDAADASRAPRADRVLALLPVAALVAVTRRRLGGLEGSGSGRPEGILVT